MILLACQHANDYDRKPRASGDDPEDNFWAGHFQ